MTKLYVDRKIVWAGDSTVAQKSFTAYPETGIGQAMPCFLAENVRVVNLAINGRSTKSWIDEQRMPKAYFTLEEGDFFFIQFGHNDKKVEDPTRYAEAFGDFQKNLKKYIEVARNRKAYPVLITPVARRMDNGDGTLVRSHEDYPDAMKALALEENVPCIDLTENSTQFIEDKGIENCRKYFMNFDSGIYERYPEGLQDNTHLRPDGAMLFAAMIAEGLYQLGGVYQDLLRPEVEAQINEDTLY